MSNTNRFIILFITLRINIIKRLLVLIRLSNTTRNSVFCIHWKQV